MPYHRPRDHTLSTHTVHETQPPVVCRQTPVTEMNNHTEMQRQGYAMPITRYTKSHKDTSAVKLEHRHCAVTEAGGKPRPLSCAVTFLVTSAPVPHGHHIPMHSHTHIQVPWNTCTHTHPLTSVYQSGAQPVPDHPVWAHGSQSCTVDPTPTPGSSLLSLPGLVQENKSPVSPPPLPP